MYMHIYCIIYFIIIYCILFTLSISNKKMLEDNMWLWTTKPVLSHTGRYICSNSQKYIVWVKIIDFSFMPKPLGY